MDKDGVNTCALHVITRFRALSIHLTLAIEMLRRWGKTIGPGYNLKGEENKCRVRLE